MKERYRPLEPLPSKVCPHCQRGVTEYRFFTPCLHPIITDHCPKCGDVIPIRHSIAPIDNAIRE
jgi:hypothetical protein